MSALVLVLATLFIPQGSEEQISKSPLAKGEVAYVQTSDDESYLKIGTDGIVATHVIDRSAIRGYQYSYLDRGDFVVLAVSNLTWNAENDTFTCSTFAVGKKYIFKFFIPHGVEFDGVEWDYKIQNTVGERSISDIVETRVGNEVTVTMTDNANYGVLLTVSGFKVRVKDFGDPDHVNDLTKMNVVIKDSLGTMKLGKWREHLAHLYDGNRGEDWAMHQASANAEMKSKWMNFGWSKRGVRQFSIGTDKIETNVVDVMYGSRWAAKVYETGGNFTPSAGMEISISSITMSDSSVLMTVDASNISNFSTDNLRLYYSESMNNGQQEFVQVPYTISGSNPLTISAPIYGERGFYQLGYGDSSIVVEICDTLKVDRLILRGEDNKWYRITVNAGAISATEVQ